jgi:hypothetical protein
MKIDKINIVCTDAQSEMQENLYEFQCGYNQGCCEVITYLKLITHGSINNKDLDEILKNLIKLNKKQNKLGYLDPGLFQPGTSV